MHKRSLLFTAALSALTALPVLTGLGACGGDPTIADRIVGVYHSAACESTPSGSFWRRYYTFTKNTWNLMTEVYTDDKCTQKALSLELGGEYTVPADAAAPADASALDLKVAFRSATPWLKANADTLNGISCGGIKDWTAGIRRDTGSGCGTVTPSLADCPILYEAASVNETQLMLGAATQAAAERCKIEARPTALGAVLTRK